MAPKRARGKRELKEKTEEERMSDPRHNMVGFLDPENKCTADYGGILEFLRRSKIAYAVSQQHTAYKSHIKAFWDSASIETINNEEVIQAKVEEKNVIMSEQIIRTVLQFNDKAVDPYTISERCYQGCLLRMKYTGDVLAGQLHKASLPLQYKYFMHVLIQCLGRLKGGYDMASSSILGMMTALTLNKDFNFSRTILENMKENLGKRARNANKFWMYPRFVQMILDTQIQDLPKIEKDILKIDVMTEYGLKVLKRLSKYNEGDVPRKMIGFLGNPEYVAPVDDKWRHAESESDDEETKLDALVETKRKEEAEGGSKKRKGKGIVIEETCGDAGGETDGDEGGDDKVIEEGDKGDGGDDEKHDDDDSEAEKLRKDGLEKYVDDKGAMRYRPNQKSTDKEADADYVPPTQETQEKRQGKRPVKGPGGGKKARKQVKIVEPAITEPSTELTTETPTEEQHMFIEAEVKNIICTDPVTTESETPTQQPASEPIDDQPQQSTSQSQSAPVQQPQFMGEDSSAARKFEDAIDSEGIVMIRDQMSEFWGQTLKQIRFINESRKRINEQGAEIKTLKDTTTAQAIEIEKLKAADVAHTAEISKLKNRNDELEKKNTELVAKNSTIKAWYKERDNKLKDAFDLQPGLESLPVLTPTPAECATDWRRASCQYFDGYANDSSPLLKKARLSSVPQPLVMIRDQLVGDVDNMTTMLVEDNTDSTTMPVDDIARTNTMASSNNTTSHQSTGWTRLTSLDTHVDTGKVSSQPDIICVQAYNVKKGVAPILESIFNKHGDIAAECVFKPASMRSAFLGIVCEVVSRIQTNDDIDNIEEIEQQVLATEAANINVSWLRAHLDVIRKRKEVSTKCSLLMEMKVNTVWVKKAAQMDLRERCVELMAAQERFEEAGRCVRVFDLVEKNLNDSILESKGNTDSWARQPVL